MSVSPFALLPLKELTHHLSIPISKPLLSSRIRACLHSQIMGSSSRIGAGQANMLFRVPDIDSGEMEHIADQTFQRYYLHSSDCRRTGKGTAIIWFRNDLRIIDNEVLYEAWRSSEVVLPVYCIDPRLFGTTHYFGFPKTGGTYIFLIEFVLFELLLFWPASLVFTRQCISYPMLGTCTRSHVNTML